MRTAHRFTRRSPRTLSYPLAAVVLAAGCAVAPAVAAVTDPDPVTLSVPEPTGPHDVGQVDLHLVDESRGHPWVPAAERRDIMVTVWYPADGGGRGPAPYMSRAVADDMLTSRIEAAGLPRDSVDLAGSTAPAVLGADAAGDPGSLPVVLYSPGFQMSRHLAAAQLAELASRGYAVAAVDHPYETDTVELPDGRVLRGQAPLDTATHTEIGTAAVSVRMADVRLTLDALAALADGRNPDAADGAVPEHLGAALDLSAVGMFGHSMGGLTAAELMVGDERIDAGIDLDGSLAYHVGDEEWAQATRHGVDRPFMIMSAGASGADGDPHTSEFSADFARFRDLSQGRTLEVYLPDGEHMSFIDSQWLLPQVDAALDPGERWREQIPASIGTVDAQRSVAVQRAYITAFFDAHLRGEHRPLLGGPSDAYPEVEFVD